MLTKKHIPTEAQEQEKLVYWLRMNSIPHFAIPNGGSRHKLEAKNLKAQGVVSGVSDIVVMLPKKILFIEMKRRKKKLKNGDYSISHTKVSKAQFDFLTMVNKHDYATGKVCYGFDEAVDFIKDNMT